MIARSTSPASVTRDGPLARTRPHRGARAGACSGRRTPQRHPARWDPGDARRRHRERQRPALRGEVARAARRHHQRRLRDGLPAVLEAALPQAAMERIPVAVRRPLPSLVIRPQARQHAESLQRVARVGSHPALPRTGRPRDRAGGRLRLRSSPGSASPRCSTSSSRSRSSTATSCSARTTCVISRTR